MYCSVLAFLITRVPYQLQRFIPWRCRTCGDWTTLENILVYAPGNETGCFECVMFGSQDEE